MLLLRVRDLEFNITRNSNSTSSYFCTRAPGSVYSATYPDTTGFYSPLYCVVMCGAIRSSNSIDAPIEFTSAHSISGCIKRSKLGPLIGHGVVAGQCCRVCIALEWEISTPHSVKQPKQYRGPQATARLRHRCQVQPGVASWVKCIHWNQWVLLVSPSHVDQLSASVWSRGQVLAEGHVMEDLGKEVFAGIGLAQDGTWLQLPLEEFGRQGINMDCIEQSMKVLGTSLCIPAHPVSTGFVDLCLTQYFQTVLTDELQQLAVR